MLTKIEMKDQTFNIYQSILSKINPQTQKNVTLHSTPTGAFIIARLFGKCFLVSVSENATVKITHNKTSNNKNKTESFCPTAAIKFVTDLNFMYR